MYNVDSHVSFYQINTFLIFMFLRVSISEPASMATIFIINRLLALLALTVALAFSSDTLKENIKKKDTFKNIGSIV